MKQRASIPTLVLTLVLSLSALPAGASVQAGGESADADASVALRAARMLDVISGELIDNPVVVIEGDRIVSTDPDEIPADAELLDLGDVTLLPGFIDAHVHLTGQLEPGFYMRQVTDTVADAAFRAAHHAEKTLMAGFTTVRNVGSAGGVDVALSEAQREGLVVSPRIVPARNALGITGGHCDVTGFAPGILEGGPKQGVADGVAEVLEAVRYQIKHGARVIKTCATAGVLSFEGPVGAQQYSLEELEAMVEEASRHGVPVAAHAHGTEGIVAAVRAGVASIEHGSMLDDEAIRLMVERGTYLVPTTYLADAIELSVLPPPVRRKAEQVLPVARESVREAIAAGVKIAFGTDAAVFPHGDNAKEFGALVDRGMEPLEALRAGTVNAADLLGVDDDRGTIEAGKLADLVAVPGNPLADIRMTEEVVFVMQGGRIFKRP